jgi:hypothetical protein
MGNTTEFVNIGAHGIETTGNLFVNNLQFTQTQGLDQILNVSNTTSNIMTLTNTSDDALNVAGGMTLGSNLHVGTDANATSALQPKSLTLGDAAPSAKWRLATGNYRLNFNKNNGSDVYERKSWIDQEGSFVSNAYGVIQMLYPDGRGTGGFSNQHGYSSNVAMAYLQTAEDDRLSMAAINTSRAGNTTKHSSIGFFNTDAAGSAKLGPVISAYPRDGNASTQKLVISTNSSQCGYNYPTATLTCDYNGGVGIGTTSASTTLHVHSATGGMYNTREDGRYLAHYIQDLNTTGITEQYNYMVAGNIPGSTNIGAVHFINGPDRTGDNGSNAYIIRNDYGRLVLGHGVDGGISGTIVRSTNIWYAQPGEIDTNVGHLIYDYSNAIAGHYLYQNIYSGPLAPTGNIVSSFQKAVQVCRQGSLVSISGYVVFKTNVTNPYLYYTWAQLGFDRSYIVNTVWNGSTLGGTATSVTAFGDSNYVYISYAGAVQSPSVVYSTIKFVLDMSHVRAYRN